MLADSDKETISVCSRDFENPGAMDRWIRRYLEWKRREGPVVFLDSQLDGHAASGRGYIAAHPVTIIRARVSDDREENSWDALKAFRSAHPDWMFGWFGYDMKNDTETLTSGHPDPVGLPDLFFFVPAVVLAVDRKQCRLEVLKGDPSELATEQPEFEDASTRMESTCANELLQGILDETTEKQPLAIGPLVSGDGWESYREKVLRIKQWITEGETYEVNLTHQLQTGCRGDSLDLFEAMRESGPVPFGAWFHYDDVAICCASPERFLQYRDGKVRSQPIKGTSPRGNSEEEDERIVTEILGKEKNRAENVMIVDLVRHDLGRIAETGSVRTESLLEVQTFSTVHQLVSTITAKPASGITPVDMIKACFPMGSMTGAPKVRTMEIIEELESYRRGIYSGAIGYFTPDGNFDFNVVIRTAIMKQNRLYYSVGGAITADSDPGEEWEETWLKAKALTRPLGR